MRNLSSRKLEKEIEKLNRLISTALEKRIKLTDVRILKQSNKVDILLIKAQR
jgi:hypothetical protein